MRRWREARLGGSMAGVIRATPARVMDES
jgi:hypothetical protein